MLALVLVTCFATVDGEQCHVDVLDHFERPAFCKRAISMSVTEFYEAVHGPGVRLFAYCRPDFPA